MFDFTNYCHAVLILTALFKIICQRHYFCGNEARFQHDCRILDADNSLLKQTDFAQSF